jgi:ligand-binding sensor domain-containing protein
MKSPTKILILTFIFLLPYYAHSQNQWRVFTTQNSILPSNLIGSIVIDRNNVKWIGTANGIVRIEGNNWQLFDMTNTHCRTNRQVVNKQPAF